MSIEIVFYPRKATRDDLVKFLKQRGYRPTKHMWEWPKGTVHLHWFEISDFKSFDGVESSVFPLSEESRVNLKTSCTWAIHTRTRAAASAVDRGQQNETIRAARKQFGGYFYNDWNGKNRYIPVEQNSSPIARGLYLLRGRVVERLKNVKYALPPPLVTAHVGVRPPPVAEVSKLDALAAKHDPARTVYNALVPFAVAALEHFFSHAFKILLRYDEQARRRLAQQSKRVEFVDALALSINAKAIEDVVAEWYSFQSIESIHKAFSDWFGIDVWKILRQKRRVGRRVGWLEKRFENLIDFRHGIVHRFELNVEFDRTAIEEIFDLSILIIETFIEHLETSRGETIRDAGVAWN